MVSGGIKHIRYSVWDLISKLDLLDTLIHRYTVLPVSFSLVVKVRYYNLQAQKLYYLRFRDKFYLHWDQAHHPEMLQWEWTQKLASSSYALARTNLNVERPRTSFPIVYRNSIHCIRYFHWHGYPFFSLCQ